MIDDILENKNCPAFPLLINLPYEISIQTGLTKRELFAAMAMQGLLSNLNELRRTGFKDHEIEEFAAIRAEALLKELEKSKNKTEDKK